MIYVGFIVLRGHFFDPPPRPVRLQLLLCFTFSSTL